MSMWQHRPLACLARRGEGAAPSSAWGLLGGASQSPRAGTPQAVRMVQPQADAGEDRLLQLHRRHLLEPCQVCRACAAAGHAPRLNAGAGASGGASSRAWPRPRAAPACPRQQSGAGRGAPPLACQPRLRALVREGGGGRGSRVWSAAGAGRARTSNVGQVGGVGQQGAVVQGPGPQHVRLQHGSDGAAQQAGRGCEQGVQRARVAGVQDGKPAHGAAVGPGAAVTQHTLEQRPSGRPNNI